MGVSSVPPDKSPPPVNTHLHTPKNSPAAQPGTSTRLNTSTSTKLSGSALSGGMAEGFRQLLGPSATAEDISKAIDNMINSAIAQMKKDQQRAEEAIKKMGKTFTGDDSD